MITEEVKNCVERFCWFFPKSFIYKENELIVEPKNNIYFRIDNIVDELGFKRKMIEYLSRPSCKGVSQWYQTRIRNSLNNFLGTKFTEEDMELIYTYLGCGCRSDKTEEFIKSGYDLNILREIKNENRK